MFLLDTNVVSELRRPEKAHPKVLAWAQAQPAALTYLSVVTILEIEMGTLSIERRNLAQGRVLRAWLDENLLPRFDGRILAIDLAAARRRAALHVPDPRGERDALIAATALVNGMTVVTRDVVDFEPMGAPVLNPWL